MTGASRCPGQASLLHRIEIHGLYCPIKRLLPPIREAHDPEIALTASCPFHNGFDGAALGTRFFCFFCEFRFLLLLVGADGAVSVAGGVGVITRKRWRGADFQSFHLYLVKVSEGGFCCNFLDRVLMGTEGDRCTSFQTCDD
ncbi:MAG: hypothetical protein J3R72DRAFT_424276 [Linnemannia gamsii]|nr:MAG: hypothetical protein J3R72DRAFT_424276 [Linnemannia gamsii]